MSKAEQVFKTVDFSAGTDLKERLRKQLFENNENFLLEKGLREDSNKASSRKGSARQLSFDELEMVNAAGILAMQSQNLKDRVKPKLFQNILENNSLNDPFFQNDPDHDN